MKKIILTLLTVALTFGLAAAQDIATITETYNNGANALSAGNKADALNYFQTALKQATALGEDGAEIANNCKTAIPNIALSIAKDLVKAADYDAAVAKLNDALAIAKELNAEAAVAEATKLIPQVLTQKGNALLKEKNFEGAAEAFKSILASDPANGVAAFRLGQALSSLGKNDDAVAAFLQAAENGQKDNAYKQLSTVFLKDASAALKDKDFAGAVAKAIESTKYAESANAYKIAGTAATSLGDKAKAVEYLSKYLELSPSAADAAQIKTAIEALKK
uniref:Tetratricopeptide repeat protein n=1 Tax=uncultured bacterium pUR16A2 TaxID=1204710 RepID=R9QZG6_9BACT|nr:hypothetical protein [uncultured bacterium pUR16A2]